MISGGAQGGMFFFFAFDSTPTRPARSARDSSPVNTATSNDQPLALPLQSGLVFLGFIKKFGVPTLQMFHAFGFGLLDFGGESFRAEPRIAGTEETDPGFVMPGTWMM